MILKSIFIVCSFVTIWVFMFTRSFKGIAKRDKERREEHERKMKRMQSEYEQKRKEFNEKWGK